MEHIEQYLCHSVCNIFLFMCQVKEVKELRSKDPKLWTVTALSNMLQVKPLAILYVILEVINSIEFFH